MKLLSKNLITAMIIMIILATVYSLIAENTKKHEEISISQLMKKQAVITETTDAILI